MTGTVGENRQHGEADEYRWKAFEGEDPLPAREPIVAVESEQPRTDRVADRAGEGDRDEAPADHDAGDPPRRDAGENEIARHLEE